MSDTERGTTNPLDPPKLPEVTRLNRNVLLVAGMAVGVVMLAVSQIARDDPRPAPRSGTLPVESGAMASFLREPMSASRGGVPVPPPAYPESARDTVPVPRSGAQTSGRESAADPFRMPYYDVYPAVNDGPPPSPRQDAYRRALRAGLRRGDPASGRAATSPSGLWDPDDPGGGMAGYAFEPYGGLERAASALAETSSVPGVTRLVSSAGASPPPYGGDRSRGFLAAAAADSERTYIASRLEKPISPYQITAGTLLPATLITGINSDLPGEILAQITRNVYDSHQRFLLIPRGTKIIGRYDDQIALGQSRVLIAWTRLILPDGRSLSLPGLATQDLRGATGLRDKVDNHYRRLYGQAMLLSVLGAGAQLSQPQQSSVLTPPSAGQVAAGALGQQLSTVSMETIRRNMDVRPTLQIRPGTPFYIFLERDLVLEGAYPDAAG